MTDAEKPLVTFHVVQPLGSPLVKPCIVHTAGAASRLTSAASLIAGSSSDGAPAPLLASAPGGTLAKPTRPHPLASNSTAASRTTAHRTMAAGRPRCSFHALRSCADCEQRMPRTLTTGCGLAGFAEIREQVGGRGGRLARELVLAAATGLLVLVFAFDAG